MTFFLINRDILPYNHRMERDGLLVGPYEEASKMRVVESWYREGVPKGFGKELYQPDLDRIQDNLEMAMERFPCLADGNIQSVVSGKSSSLVRSLFCFSLFAVEVIVLVFCFSAGLFSRFTVLLNCDR